MNRQALPTPPAEATVDDVAWRISRAWPLGDDPAAGLTVEADSGDGSVRAGLWRDDELELQPVGTDPKLGALAEVAASGTVVSHRFRKRAVVRLGGADATEYVKVVRPGRAAAILDGIQRARAFEAGFRTPEVLGGSDATVRFSALPGRSLHEEAAFTDDEWAQAWAAVAAGLASSHAGAHSDAESGQPHTVADEVRVLDEWFGRAAAWVADPVALRVLVDRAVEVLGALGDHGWVPTHRDLHDKQLLWEPELGPGLLDVDTACLAHPALDLGNLRAHAQWRVMQGVWTQQGADVVTDAVDSAAANLGVDPTAVAVFERATLVRICCVYAFRPRYAGTAQKLQECLGL